MSLSSFCFNCFFVFFSFYMNVSRFRAVASTSSGSYSTSRFVHPPIHPSIHRWRSKCTSNRCHLTGPYPPRFTSYLLSLLLFFLFFLFIHLFVCCSRSMFSDACFDQVSTNRKQPRFYPVLSLLLESTYYIHITCGSLRGLSYPC